jgi:hypothetical protein
MCCGDTMLLLLEIRARLNGPTILRMTFGGCPSPDPAIKGHQRLTKADSVSGGIALTGQFRVWLIAILLGSSQSGQGRIAFRRVGSAPDPRRRGDPVLYTSRANASRRRRAGPPPPNLSSAATVETEIVDGQPKWQMDWVT